MGGCRSRSEPIPFVQPEMDIGMIVMWFGTEAAIPAGWQKCDGTNGTPNLTTDFTRGASNDGNKGGIGGVGNHDHTFTGDGHVHNHVAGPPFIDGSGSPAFQTTVSSQPAVGTTNVTDGRPPWVRVFYIQKVA